MQILEPTYRRGPFLWVVVIGLLLLCWGTLGISKPLALAQEGENWDPALLLSRNIGGQTGIPVRSSYPVLVTDEWGRVHAFWVSTFDEKKIIGDTLFYAFWGGTEWSRPVDILYTPEKTIWIPRVAVDSQGWLHVVWTDNQLGQIWAMRVPATEAASISAWSSPGRVIDGTASGLSIAVDSQNNLHVVCCVGGRYAGVYHISSADGMNWSTPDFIGELGDTVIEFPECKTGLSVDYTDRLHVAWGQSLVIGTPIYYSRSDDAGLSWLAPVEIDRLNDRYGGGYRPGRPNILTIGSDEVHVVWFGPPAGQRWHRWSADGGDTWSAPEQISPIMRGFMEPPALATDSSGTLHLVSMGWLELDTEEDPFGAFHTSWHNGRWSPLTMIEYERDDKIQHNSVSSGEGGGEFATIAITDGNLLHVVWELGLAEIWTSNLRTYAPYVPPESKSPPQASPTIQLANSITPPETTPLSDGATPKITAVSTVSLSNITPEEGYALEQVILIAVLPTALLVGLTVLAQRLRGRF